MIFYEENYVLLFNKLCRQLYQASTQSFLKCQIIALIWLVCILMGKAVGKKYRVRLTADERTYLESLIHKNKVAAQKSSCWILLKVDIINWGEKWQDQKIAVVLHNQTW